MLPLAAFAGLRVVRLDEQACTRPPPRRLAHENPFASTYFAAQAMAAEMSTGAPGLVLREDAPRSVSMLVSACTRTTCKRLTGPGSFTCEDVPAIRAAIERAAASDEPSRLGPLRSAATPTAKTSPSSSSMVVQAPGSSLAGSLDAPAIAP